ncbi:MAG: hypothetical protein ACK5EA_02555, partial [Planctomycetaceae bacterium]
GFWHTPGAFAEELTRTPPRLSISATRTGNRSVFQAVEVPTQLLFFPQPASIPPPSAISTTLGSHRTPTGNQPTRLPPVTISPLAPPDCYPLQPASPDNPTAGEPPQ